MCEKVLGTGTTEDAQGKFMIPLYRASWAHFGMDR
jgi:hypothetical protein